MQRIGIFGKKKGSAADDSEVNGEDDLAPDNENQHNEAAVDNTAFFSKRQPRAGARATDPAADNVPNESGVARPSYRTSAHRDGDDPNHHRDEDDHHDDDSLSDEGSIHQDDHRKITTGNIEQSAGTSRLNRILRTTQTTADTKNKQQQETLFGGPAIERTVHEKVSDVQNLEQVAQYCGRVVIPPLKVDNHSIGGHMLDGYPESMQQECLLTQTCHDFESTGAESVVLQALQFPNDYSKHKRSLGLFGGGKGRATKIRYLLVCRSTNRLLLEASRQRQRDVLLRKQQAQQQEQMEVQEENEETERDDYDAMFAPDDDESRELSMGSDNDFNNNVIKEKRSNPDPKKQQPKVASSKQPDNAEIDVNQIAVTDEDEISSFPVLVCMTLHNDGTCPDIRKLIPLHQLTTVQDLHSSVVQLAFQNGDTIRLDFGDDEERNKIVERPLDKERFIWSLLQIHAMLCSVVMERNSRGTSFLPPLNVRNLDRAELQYVATVNGFLKKNESLRILLDRQRKSLHDDSNDMMTVGAARSKKKSASASVEEKEDPGDMDAMAYDLMMGNFATRVTLFHSDDERKDAEEILNSTEWTDMLSKEDTAAVSVAERLAFMLQSRMRDLEAETCRRLIAWEDEKHLSLSGRAKLHDASDARDTVDALALASLFKTLESLDTELGSMEDWLQDRAAAIKPLTDDCADIEEENRQLEQQWKSYDMLGVEMKRLLKGQEIDEDTQEILKNPASALVYDEDGYVDVDESEDGIDRIYEAGKSLLDAIEFPKKSGGIHLKAVSERAKGLGAISNTYCSSLAQIIVTVMEQFKSEVVAGSDNGKVSKNDTHSMIAKKIRETQRKFQSSLLGYIKLIEILASLSPEMLPALRDAYAEMVSEGILMKKRMKGYFQALPGKNVAYLNRVGKNLKDYVPNNGTFREETVNAPDLRAVLGELLPVIAREAYFTSALFGSSSREQDGREKKRNFENAKSAVDKASMHFRYYVSRTCGIIESEKADLDSAQRGDPLLCLVATINLNEAMDNYIDREKKGGDQSLSLAYVRATILDLRKRADKQWVSWVERQLEWIKSNDGVPLNGKRAGIFPSFARFPAYLDHVILCCREGREDTYSPDLPGIKVINYYQQKIAVTLLESLKDCAGRETTDQSYASNVMQMENTYFLTQSIKERGDSMSKLFAKQVTKANAICKDSTDAYLGWMIKREFTALHELFSRVSKIRKELGDNEVVSHVPKNLFVKTLQKEANRDILKEKIGSMFSRMEKHLSEEGGLLPVAWKALVKVLYEWFGRWEKLCSSIYKYKLDPSPVDVVRIAKAAGGAAKPKVASQGTEFGFKSILALGNKDKMVPE